MISFPVEKPERLLYFVVVLEPFLFYEFVWFFFSFIIWFFLKGNQYLITMEKILIKIKLSLFVLGLNPVKYFSGTKSFYCCVSFGVFIA